MILLSAVCLILYLLGGVLAWELCDVLSETAPQERQRVSFRDPVTHLLAVLLWPSLAFYLLTHRDDGEAAE